MAFIPGYDAVLELGSSPTDVSAVGKTIDLTKTYTLLNRTVFGSAAQGRGSGVYGVKFTFQALVDSTTYGTIEGFVDGTSQAFSLEVGDSGGTSAGTWAGNCIINEITAKADVEGDWMVTISAESTGAVTFT